MLTAIRELASHKDECTASHHIAVAEYLEACNQLFEEGILSHEVINSQTSPALQRMKLGFTFFENWHKELSQSETGNVLFILCMYRVNVILSYTCRGETPQPSPKGISGLAG